MSWAGELARLADAVSVLAFVAFALLGLTLLVTPARIILPIYARKRAEIGLTFLFGAASRATDVLHWPALSTGARLSAAIVAILTAVVMLVRVAEARRGGD